ncbi:MAG: protein-L-isoaspartate(D-aspartate) O-methyltransferase [Gemmatimonadota bacterium]
MTDFATLRSHMVRSQVEDRGIRDRKILDAMRAVPREIFVSEGLAEFAYDDTPLPIEEGQTISQPFIVAIMIAAVRPAPGDRVLEVGTGSGYAAAVLAQVAGEVYTIERHATLAEMARQRLARLGLANVRVLEGDGSLGWPEHAPYDAIIVAAGGPQVPEMLLEQLALGGRLVIPIGPTPRTQQLVRITRSSETGYDRERMGDVQFVPLVGIAGWSPEVEEAPSAGAGVSAPGMGTRARHAVSALIRETAEPLSDIESADLDAFVERIGDARVVLLGEATHGSSEFYRMRARITRELILRKGFTIVAAEADWPDAARVDRYVRHRPVDSVAWRAFSRFPSWMWRNAEIHELFEWLREHNTSVTEPERQAGFYGLDLYSLHTSIEAVLAYLDDVDPDAAGVARARYGCLTPWERDPAVYGRSVITGRYGSCEPQVVAMLEEMLARRLELMARDGERLFDATQNARLVAGAERYYRTMYYGSVESWNLRDRHMFETLGNILAFRGPDARAIVWAHNSHVGNASATEMGTRGEFNIGELSRESFGDAAYLVGFGTDRGTVAAASNWGEPMRIMAVRPSLSESYERLCYDSDVAAFLLPLRVPARQAVREELTPSRLERAIGVIYRPETELQSHYFHASLPRQFDEYIWFDETRAVASLPPRPREGVPDTYPFGL